MIQKSLHPLWTIVVVLLFVVCTTATAQNNKHIRPLVTDTPMVHDPVMAYENGQYYLYSTGRRLQLMTSPNRRTWTLHRQGAMPAIPQWTHDSVPGFKEHVWAPDIIRWRDRWWLAYSCSTFGKNTSAIGLMSVDSLAHYSQWRDEGCIVASQRHRDDWNAIDPNFVVGEDGQLWLTFGSFWDGIQIVRLDSSLHIARGNRPTTIARRRGKGTEVESNPTSKYAGTNAIEAPFIFRHNDYYYLFVSWDYCCRGNKSTYRVVVGRSNSVEGPYLDRNGTPMTEGGGTPFFKGDKHLLEAAGHCAAYHFDDGDFCVCHGYSLQHGGASILIHRPILWDADDWPCIGNTN